MSREAIEEAIEVLEDASAEMLMETGDKNYYVEAIAVLRQALVDADDTSQERVDGCVRGHQGVLSMSENKNAKTPADDGQPVAWSCQCGRPYTVTCISSKPQKKEWVGLTDDDYEELLRTRDWGVSLIEAVEAKLKEKNT